MIGVMEVDAGPGMVMLQAARMVQPPGFCAMPDGTLYVVTAENRLMELLPPARERWAVVGTTGSSNVAL